MRRISSQSQLKRTPASDDDGTREESGGKGLRDHHKRGTGKQQCSSQDESPSVEEYGRWRQEQNAGVTRLKKLLKATESMKTLIDDRVRGYQSYYNRWSHPNWAPVYEQAAVFWFGEWRPSAIATLVVSLSLNHFFDAYSVEADQTLSQLIHNLRIEEAVIDEEMIEIQANCILQLPFGSVKSIGNGSIASELKKVHGVIAKAQKLRASTVEMVVKKVLSQTDGARFLVAFGEIQDAVHDFSVKYQNRKGPVSITELPFSQS